MIWLLGQIVITDWLLGKMIIQLQASHTGGLNFMTSSWGESWRVISSAWQSLMLLLISPLEAADSYIEVCRLQGTWCWGHCSWVYKVSVCAEWEVFWCFALGYLFELFIVKVRDHFLVSALFQCVWWCGCSVRESLLNCWVHNILMWFAIGSRLVSWCRWFIGAIWR